MFRDVLHINVTSFPVGVERVVDSSLRERPVVVSAMNSARAVVLALSREAYLEGVRKGMPALQARKFCRGLVIIPPNQPLYRRASRAVHRLLADYSPLIEPWRMGHLHIDMTGSRRLFGPSVDIGARINREIRERLRLRNTVGVARNKLVSRVASRVIRPRGLCEVFPGSEAEFIAPLEVDMLPGIGTRTEAALSDFNICLVGELAAIPAEHLAMAFGPLGFRLHQYARGIDHSPVRPPELAPAVQEEETLAEDANDDYTVLAALYLLVERAGRRLRKLGRRARTVKLELTYSDYVTVKSRAKLAEPDDLDGAIFREARILLERTWTRRTRLRYLCLTLTDLVGGARQLKLFEDREQRPERDRNLNAALDKIRERYGRDAVRYGRTL
jgi:DNA polymerase-4